MHFRMKVHKMGSNHGGELRAQTPDNKMDDRRRFQGNILFVISDTITCTCVCTPLGIRSGDLKCRLGGRCSVGYMTKWYFVTPPVSFHMKFVNTSILHEIHVESSQHKLLYSYLILLSTRISDGRLWHVSFKCRLEVEVYWVKVSVRKNITTWGSDDNDFFEADRLAEPLTKFFLNQVWTLLTLMSCWGYQRRLAFMV